MKRLCTLTILILLGFLATASPVEIWVSPSGDDSNSGSMDAPVSSLFMAQRKARELRRLNDPSIVSGINIILKDGLYQLDETLFLRPEDSGIEGSPIRYMAAPGANPVISGGVKVTGWQKHSGSINGLPREARGNIWVAEIPRVGGNRLMFRQMWVNNRKADRATNLSDGSLARILAVDKENEILWIPKPAFPLNEIKNLEFTIHQWWAIANLRVRDMRQVGDSVAVTFHQPESRVEFEHPWPAPFIDEKNELNGNSAFFFSNAVELLNKPGEWFADMDAGKIYYWPRAGEDLRRADVVVPYLETLVKLEGTLDNPVEHIHFTGISFQHTTWLRPSLQGHVPLQAGMFLKEAYNLEVKGTPDKAALCNLAWLGRQPAGIILRAASNIRIEDCEIRHMAATGVDLEYATSNNTIQGNLITDIGGNGIQIGFFGNDAVEAHYPYNPKDKREVCRHEFIANNLIANATNEDWGCVGISVGFAHDINIEHNEVTDINYSGICIGWGWTSTVTCMKNNRVHANKIHRFAKMMYDVGGIYTLSAQPNTVISENAIFDLMEAPYAHIPDHHQYIYFDEGSSYIRAVNNWTERDKFFSNTPGPGNEWVNNGPQVSDEIRQKAGLLPEYKHLVEKLKELK